jgi:hypothetical protein
MRAVSVPVALFCRFQMRTWREEIKRVSTLLALHYYPLVVYGTLAVRGPYVGSKEILTSLAA